MLNLDPNEFHRNSNSLRGTRLRVEDAPQWVIRRKVKNAGRIDGHPVTTLLFDRQIQPDKAARYTRYVRRLETPQAVQEAGKIELDFDPATQTLIIHAISIFRQGELTNLLNLEDIEIIQRERDLERGIYAGTITALILLKDIRTGDVIDIESSIVSDAAIFPGHYWFTENFEHSVPVVRQYFSWLSKDHARYTVRSTADQLHEEDESTQWGIRKTWHVENTVALEPEPALPIGMNPYKNIAISDYESWHQVASEIANLWEGRSDPGPELPKELTKLQAANTASDTQLIEACVAFVRDNIRYQGVEIGRLGLVPEMLHEIWDRRYGDCKEKTNMLCWLLRQCGFDASPALVSTALRAYVEKQLPAPIFDHVVVHLLYQGQHYWIDPTNISQRGSLDSWVSLPFQKALLISHASTGFLDIANPAPDTNKVKVTESYKFNSGTTAILDVTHEYFGAEADQVRQALDSAGRTAVQQIFVDIVKATRTEAELEEDLQVTDEPMLNHLTLKGRFKAPNTLKRDPKRGSYFCEFVPHSLLGKIVGVEDKPRTNPLGIIHPVEVEHVTHVGHPEARGAIVPRTNIDNEFIQFEAGTRNENQKPELFYKFRTKTSEISARDLTRYQVNLDQIERAISMVFECQNRIPSGSRSTRKSAAAANPAWDEGEYDNQPPHRHHRHSRHRDHNHNSNTKIPVGLICIGLFVIIKVIILISTSAN